MTDCGVKEKLTWVEGLLMADIACQSLGEVRLRIADGGWRMADWGFQIFDNGQYEDYDYSDNI